MQKGKQMRAVPFKVEKSDKSRYFDLYYYYCMDCGEYVEWENNMWIERAE